MICSMSIFPSFFFQKYFVRKKWRDGGELGLKNGAIDGFTYQTCIFRSEFSLRGPVALSGFLQHLPAKYK